MFMLLGIYRRRKKQKKKKKITYTGKEKIFYLHFCNSKISLDASLVPGVGLEPTRPKKDMGF